MRYEGQGEREAPFQVGEFRVELVTVGEQCVCG